MERAECSERDREANTSDLDALLFRNLLAGTADILYFKNLDSRYLRLSCGAADALRGGDPDAEVGRWDFDHYEASHAQKAFDQEQTIIRTGHGLVDTVEQQKWPDRADTWVSTTKLPLTDDDGVIIGTFGISRDITARVKAEHERQRIADALERTNQDLERTQEQLRLILETTSDAIARYDAELRYTYLNPAAVALFGGESADRLGRTPRELGLPENFIVVCEHITDQADLARLVTRVEHALSLPFSASAPGVRISASVGGATTTTASANASQLLRAADTAMYASKYAVNG
jgi:PAS domain-containing protein